MHNSTNMLQLTIQTITMAKKTTSQKIISNGELQMKNIKVSSKLKCMDVGIGEGRGKDG